MAKVVLRQEAIDDLNNIWEYTSVRWSENQADTYYAMLKLACQSIGENPGLGKQYHQISPAVFGLIAGKHIVFYQMKDGDEIDIIRILHQRMDLKDRLTE